MREGRESLIPFVNYVQQRGDSDCLRAALATILGLTYDDVPESVCDAENQHNNMQAFLAEHGLIAWNLSLNGDPQRPILAINQHEEIRYHVFPPGLWLASVRSPRNDDDHVVVMKGTEILWDPHQQREMGHGGFTEAIFLMPRFHGARREGWEPREVTGITAEDES